MNILPKKRWHVRTKENIARVRRDEAKAAEEEKEKQRRISLAEQEARTELLRNRARVRDVESDRLAVAIPKAGEHHVNFFAELEDGKKTHGVNKEHEAEKRQEQEDLEKKIGLLTYLGQDCAEEKDLKPWYFDPPSKKLKRENDEEKKKEVGCKTKSFLDPLKTIHLYVPPTSVGKATTTKTTSQPKETLINHSMKESKKSKHKHKRKHKHKEREKDRTVTSSGRSLEDLRTERLRREKAERLRVEQLMAKLEGRPEPKASVREERPVQKYNSQYNPHLAKQNDPSTVN